MDRPRSFGEQLDAVGMRLDAAYAARRAATPGTAAYANADEAVEAAYSALRNVNASIRARLGCGHLWTNATVCARASTIHRCTAHDDEHHCVCGASL